MVSSRKRLLVCAALLLTAAPRLPGLVRLNALNLATERAEAEAGRAPCPAAPAPPSAGPGLSRGTVDSARIRFALACQGSDRAVALLTSSASEPIDTSVMFLVGRRLFQENRVADAITWLRRVPGSDMYLMHEGRRLSRRRWTADAVAAFQIAAAVGQRSQLAQQAWGVAQLNGLGDWEGAARSFQRALAIGPEVADLHVQAGDAFLKGNRYEEAVRHTRRAVEMAPRNAWAWNSYGNVLCAAGKGREAEAAWSRAVALEPVALAALTTAGCPQ